MIVNSEKSDVIEDRLIILLNVLTESIYSNVCRGLFNAHKRIFSFLVTIKIELKSGSISANDWRLFIRGALLS